MLPHLSPICGHEKNGFQIAAIWGIASFYTMQSLQEQKYPQSMLLTSSILLQLTESVFLTFYTDKELGKRSWVGYSELLSQLEVRTDI